MHSRKLLITALLALASSAHAGRSTEGIGDYFGVFVETVVGQYQQLCSARQPETATLWKAATQRWRDANADQLRELRRVARALEAATQARGLRADEPEAQRAPLLTMFPLAAMLVASKPAQELATANDGHAGELCGQWRAAISETGDLQTGLPGLITGAKRTLQAMSGPIR